MKTDKQNKKSQFIRQAVRTYPEDRWNGFEDKSNYSTAEITLAIRIHINTEMAMSTMISWPIPMSKSGEMSLLFFLYNITGPDAKRCLRAPFCKVLSPMDTYQKVQFEMTEPQSFNLDVPPRESLGDPYIIRKYKSFRNQPVNSDNVTKWREKIIEMTDRVMEIYPRNSQDLTAEEKEIVCLYFDLLVSVIEQPFVPAYKSLNLHFFDWLEEVVGCDIDPFLVSLNSVRTYTC